ncbi:BaeS Signal transduction histidine kinase [Comamonadaceae bacterium]
MHIMRLPTSLLKPNVTLASSELSILFSRLLRTTTAASVLYLLVSPLLGSHINTLIAPALISIAGLVCIGLQSRGRFKTAIAMYAWMLWSVVALQSAIRGGALNPILNVDLIVILVAGWLLGMRHAFQLAIATVLWLIALPVLQEAGWIHPEPTTNPWGILLAQVVILTGGFLSFRLVLGAYQQHVQNVQTLNASLAEKLGDLSRKEAALRESEQRVNQILQASPLPMLVSEFERGTCLEINPAWERSFERARKDVIGRTAVELGMWRDESLRRVFKQQFADKGRVEGFEVRHDLPGGGVRTLLLSSERFSYGGQSCVLTISVDVTERKRLEQALMDLNANLEQRVSERTRALDEANQHLTQTMANLQRAQDELISIEKLASLGSLVAGVAHELNTPIGNALITISALQEKSERASREVMAGSLKKSAFQEFMHSLVEGTTLSRRSLERAVNLIGSFKQVAVDQESERRRTFDVRETVHEVVDMLRPSIKFQRHQLSVEIPEGLLVESFPGPLGQVVMNLVSNAMVHGLADRADGAVQVSAASAPDDKFFVLTVQDNGCGIPPENLARVFDPFFTTRLGQGGSGLGLSVSHRIVTRILGGRIKVSSTLGEGCVLEMTLPKVAPQVVN